MAESTEFSRLILKRTGTSGTEPTVPSTETIDENWLATDLKKGEAFVNLADDKAWIRTNNGIVEFELGGTGASTQTTDATPTTIVTVSTTTDSITMIESKIIAIQDDQTTGYGATLVSIYRNDSGTLTKVGETLDENTEFTTATSGTNTSSEDVLIQVVGEAATNIDWLVKTKVTYLAN